MPLFLGLDASTQSLKASLLSARLDILAECAVHFDSDLPAYNTKGGVRFGHNGEVNSPVMMYVDAIDLLFERIKRKGWDVADIKGVAAAGQQHASVYWNRSSTHILSSVDPSNSLTSQLRDAFSRMVVPNWQDSSTTAECQSLEDAVGGPQALAEITGSRAHQRFTGPQIMRFKKIDPEAYGRTARISLVSSAITTLLCLDGEIKGIDESDACGMNLWAMNRKERGWSEELLEVIGGGAEGADELARKLGTVETDGGRIVGQIGKWFVERYGFSPDCAVFPGTGDNPATFLSLTLRESEGLISLGTSDVVLISTNTYHPDAEHHAFYHPAQIAPPSEQETEKRSGSEPLRYFNMVVYKNGSLTREHVRDVYFDKSWDKFNAAIEQLRPKQVTDLPASAAFWWLLPDIVPQGAHGTYKYTTSPKAGHLFELPSAVRVQHFPDVRQEALALLSTQLLSYRSRSSTILSDGGGPFVASTPALESPAPRVGRMYATGGASKNKTILSLLADVLSTKVCRNVEYLDGEWSDAEWNSCSVGVAFKARWGWARANAQTEAGKWISFDQVIQECRAERRKLRGGEGEEKDLEEEGIRVVAQPGEGARAFERRIEWWKGLEQKALEDQAAGEL
ncbi:xylulokinase [Cryptococcus wingfieldii CBS 7118]|uniref:Xylulose kinase n=1 Tax=Cryptococcus wingfieldii CBS 7118 TaxID=1295528 RepID=A0A1E3ID95_9TREE|nr:xylulokinase [Cryptococcus wingfieldii CBS 7118]ODN86550.1 xylulokinase [Cryptococcus wingfieldii CBS 7118]